VKLKPDPSVKSTPKPPKLGKPGAAG
jgi:hypothetical protein